MALRPVAPGRGDADARVRAGIEVGTSCGGGDRRRSGSRLLTMKSAATTLRFLNRASAKRCVALATRTHRRARSATREAGEQRAWRVPPPPPGPAPKRATLEAAPIAVLPPAPLVTDDAASESEFHVSARKAVSRLEGNHTFEYQKSRAVRDVRAFYPDDERRAAVVDALRRCLEMRSRMYPSRLATRAENDKTRRLRELYAEATNIHEAKQSAIDATAAPLERDDDEPSVAIHDVYEHHDLLELEERDAPSPSRHDTPAIFLRALPPLLVAALAAALPRSALDTLASATARFALRIFLSCAVLWASIAAFLLLLGLRYSLSPRPLLAATATVLRRLRPSTTLVLGVLVLSSVRATGVDREREGSFRSPRASPFPSSLPFKSPPPCFPQSKLTAPSLARAGRCHSSARFFLLLRASRRGQSALYKLNNSTRRRPPLPLALSWRRLCITRRRNEAHAAFCGSTPASPVRCSPRNY